MSTDFSSLRTAFPDIPILIGEWVVSPVHSEPAARWKYYDYLSRLALQNEFSTIIWDAGNDVLDRQNHAWFDPIGVSIHINAINGARNSLPDSTIDPSQSSQDTSAFIFVRDVDAVSDQRRPFLFNGNSVAGITDGNGALVEGSDFVLDESGITFTESFLSPYFPSGGENGVKASLVISFSAGADIVVQMVQWAPPELPSSSSHAVEGAEVAVAVDWQGIEKPATVAAYLSDGSPLVDSWTVNLGPLQRGRTTFNGQWSWNCRSFNGSYRL